MTWVVVIDRSKTPPPPYRPEDYTEMPPIVYGPFATEIEAAAEAQSDSGVIFACITIDCKAEGWTCDDVFWTDSEVPDDAHLVGRDLAMVCQEFDALLDFTDGWGEPGRELATALVDTLNTLIANAESGEELSWVNEDDASSIDKAKALLTRYERLNL